MGEVISPGRAFSLSKSLALAKGSSGLAAQRPKGPTPARLEVQDLGLTSLDPMGLGPEGLGIYPLRAVT